MADLVRPPLRFQVHTPRRVARKGQLGFQVRRYLRLELRVRQRPMLERFDMG